MNAALNPLQLALLLVGVPLLLVGLLAAIGVI
jgi:hypothetical protein